MIHHDQLWYIPGIQGSTSTDQSTTLIKWRRKSHDDLNRCRKSIWQNSTFIYDKNSQQSGHRGDVPQHNKGHMRQAHS